MNAQPSVILQAAHDHYAHYGIEYPVPIYETAPQAVADRYNFAAAATGPIIWFAPDTARAVNRLSWVATRPTVKLRVRAWRACADECSMAAIVVLHESAHAAQIHADPSMLDGPYDTPRVEGYAEAVAIDLYPGFIRRLVGKTMPCTLWVSPDMPDGQPTSGRTCADTQPIEAYATYVNRARMASQVATGLPWQSPQAKWWRFQQLLTPVATG